MTSTFPFLLYAMSTALKLLAKKAFLPAPGLLFVREEFITVHPKAEAIPLFRSTYLNSTKTPVLSGSI
jgi:hypothetical protein